MMKISKKKGKQQGDKRMSYVVTEAGIVEVLVYQHCFFGTFKNLSKKPKIWLF